MEQHSQLYDGFASISPQQGLEAFGRLLQVDSPQIGVMPFDARGWGELYPSIGATLLSQLVIADDSRSKQTKRKKEQATLTHDGLLQAEDSQRESLLRHYLHGIVARRLGVSISAFGVDDTFISLGLDSLMTLEIRNRIVDDLRLTIPPVKFIENPTIAQLGTAVYERWLEINLPVDVEKTLEFAEIRERLAMLSDEEVDSSLRELLVGANQS
jgi:acyl carrier protein